MTEARAPNWVAIIAVLTIVGILFLWTNSQIVKSKRCDAGMARAEQVEDLRHPWWKLGSDLDRDRAVAEYADAIGC